MQWNGVNNDVSRNWQCEREGVLECSWILEFWNMMRLPYQSKHSHIFRLTITHSVGTLARETLSKLIITGLGQNTCHLLLSSFRATSRHSLTTPAGSLQNQHQQQHEKQQPKQNNSSTSNKKDKDENNHKISQDLAWKFWTIANSL